MFSYGTKRPLAILDLGPRPFWLEPPLDLNAPQFQKRCNTTLHIATSKMAYPVGRFFDEMAIPQSDSELLTKRCIEAELEEEIDVAFIDAGMIEDILKEDARRLGEILLNAARLAKPMVAGWARAGALFGGGGGGRVRRGA